MRKVEGAVYGWPPTSVNGINEAIYGWPLTSVNGMKHVLFSSVNVTTLYFGHDFDVCQTLTSLASLKPEAHCLILAGFFLTIFVILRQL